MFNLKIETDNDAFKPTQYETMKELIDILEKVKVQLLTGSIENFAVDVNGNNVGYWTWEIDDDG